MASSCTRGHIGHDKIIRHSSIFQAGIHFRHSSGSVPGPASSKMKIQKCWMSDKKPSVGQNNERLADLDIRTGCGFGA
jgi:hypothetical protein